MKADYVRGKRTKCQLHEQWANDLRLLLAASLDDGKTVLSAQEAILHRSPKDPTSLIDFPSPPEFPVRVRTTPSKETKWGMPAGKVTSPGSLAHTKTGKKDKTIECMETTRRR